MSNKFTVPLTSEAYYLAENFQKIHHSSQKAKQIYLNTLAIYAANFYCQFMGIETDWKNSDSFDWTNQVFLNIADLNLPNFGRLECCPILPNQNNLDIPVETREKDRLGYLIVEINEQKKQAVIKKFCQTDKLPRNQDNVLVENLQPLDSFLDYIEQIEEASTDNSNRINLEMVNEKVTSLTNWFENSFNHGWKSIEFLRKNYVNKLQKRFFSLPSKQKEQKDTQTAYKTIKLCKDCSLAYVADIKLESTKEIDIMLRIYPNQEDQKYLPSGLKLSVIDNLGDVFLETQTEKKDECLQIKFKGGQTKKFILKTELKGESIEEEFVI